MSPALIAAGVQAATGLGQMLFSGKNKAMRELEAQTKNAPMATRSKSISDYYNAALSRFQENPYQSQQYQNAIKNAQRATAAGLGAMQDRRGGLAAASRMAGIQNQAADVAGARAEQEKNQRFGQLAGATQMQSAEDRRLFQQNVLSPYERRLQLATMKAQGAANVFNAGMSNLAGAGTTAALMGSGATGGGASVPSSYAPQSYRPESTIASMRSVGMPSVPTTLTRKAMNLHPMPLYIGQ